MKKAKKIVALLLCALLLIGASVAGTMAYLTFQTDEVTNTFTVGKVEIKLDEEGATERDDQTVGLDLHLVPNVPVNKEPVVTVLKDSEDCYVRVKVTVYLPNWTDDAAKLAEWMTDEQNFADAFEDWAERFAGNYLVAGSVYGFNYTDWDLFGTEIDPNAKEITYTLDYKNGSTNNIVSKNTTENTVLGAVFDKVVAPRTLTKDQLALLQGMEIKVEAYAIQAEGFEAEGAMTAQQNAWIAFNG